MIHPLIYPLIIKQILSFLEREEIEIKLQIHDNIARSDYFKSKIHLSQWSVKVYNTFSLLVKLIKEWVLISNHWWNPCSHEISYRRIFVLIETRIDVNVWKNKAFRFLRGWDILFYPVSIHNTFSLVIDRNSLRQ